MVFVVIDIYTCKQAYYPFKYPDFKCSICVNDYEVLVVAGIRGIRKPNK